MQNLTGFAIAKECAIDRCVFEAAEYFNSFAVWVEIAHMHGISMPHAGRIKTASVIIHSHRAPGDLIAPIAINISNGEIVVALTMVLRSPVSGIELPAENYFLIDYIVGTHDGFGVNTSACENAWFHSIKVGCPEKELVGTVAVTIAPIRRTATRNEINAVEFGSS